jgi:hypothetical protein
MKVAAVGAIHRTGPVVAVRAGMTLKVRADKNRTGRSLMNMSFELLRIVTIPSSGKDVSPSQLTTMPPSLMLMTRPIFVLHTATASSGWAYLLYFRCSLKVVSI